MPCTWLSLSPWRTLPQHTCCMSPRKSASDTEPLWSRAVLRGSASCSASSRTPDRAWLPFCLCTGCAGLRSYQKSNRKWDISFDMITGITFIDEAMAESDQPGFWPVRPRHRTPLHPQRLCCMHGLGADPDVCGRQPPKSSSTHSAAARMPTSPRKGLTDLFLQHAVLEAELFAPSRQGLPNQQHRTGGGQSAGAAQLPHQHALLCPACPGPGGPGQPSPARRRLPRGSLHAPQYRIWLQWTIASYTAHRAHIRVTGPPARGVGARRPCRPPELVSLDDGQHASQPTYAQHMVQVGA